MSQPTQSDGQADGGSGRGRLSALGHTHAHAAARPGVAPHAHHGPGPIAVLVAGGAIGTLTRYGVERALPAATAGFPWATFGVNVAGTFVLATVLTVLVARHPGDRWLRPLIAVGFCGGLTTFSTLMVEVDQRVQHGHTAVAVTYLVATVVAGVVAAAAGAAVAGGAVTTFGRAVPDPDLLAVDEPPEGATGGGPA